MLKGTQIRFGKDAIEYRNIINRLHNVMSKNDVHELVVPVIWESSTFDQKITGDTKQQMWKFKDQGNRECCLIPEVTGIVQQIYNEQWAKELPKPIW